MHLLGRAELISEPENPAPIQLAATQRLILGSIHNSIKNQIHKAKLSFSNGNGGDDVIINHSDHDIHLQLLRLPLPSKHAAGAAKPSFIAAQPQRASDSSASPSSSSLSAEASAAMCPALANANANVMFFRSAYNVQVIVDENEHEEKLLGRFRREVMRAGIIQECKRRKFFENRQEEKKRRTRDAAKRNRKRRPFRPAVAEGADATKLKKDSDDGDNWDLPEGL